MDAIYGLEILDDQNTQDTQEEQKTLDAWMDEMCVIVRRSMFQEFCDCLNSSN